jgi:hypothetical protein
MNYRPIVGLLAAITLLLGCMIGISLKRTVMITDNSTRTYNIRIPHNEEPSYDYKTIRGMEEYEGPSQVVEAIPKVRIPLKEWEGVIRIDTDDTFDKDHNLLKWKGEQLFGPDGKDIGIAGYEFPKPLQGIPVEPQPASEN